MARSRLHGPPRGEYGAVLLGDYPKCHTLAAQAVAKLFLAGEREGSPLAGQPWLD